jgi:hypothetical protein
MHPGRRLVERLDRLNAGANLVALHFGGENNNTALPGSNRSRYCASPSAKSTAS